MALVDLILLLIVVGIVLWLISFLPIDAKIKQIIHIVVIIAVILLLLNLFFPALGNLRVGRQ